MTSQLDLVNFIIFILFIVSAPSLMSISYFVLFCFCLSRIPPEIKKSKKKNRLDLCQFWRTGETINPILIMGVPRLCSRKLKNIEGPMFTVCQKKLKKGRFYLLPHPSPTCTHPLICQVRVKPSFSYLQIAIFNFNLQISNIAVTRLIDS